MIKKIVSGGQTGVDQAALSVARELDITIGGWCPKGGLDENGKCILDLYPLQEASTSDPNERTKLNIEDSDGTLIIVPIWPLPSTIKDGTMLTHTHAVEKNKPRIIYSIVKPDIPIEIHPDVIFDISSLAKWIKKNNIETLNIGGPRESNSIGINKLSCALLTELFSLLTTHPTPHEKF